MPIIEINLLPKHFKKRKGALNMGKHGIYGVMAVVGVLVMFASITFWQLYQMDRLEGQMEIARARTLQLQKDIQLVDALTDIKGKITARLEAVERLDRHRSAWVKILEDMSGNIPDFVWLSRFEETVPQKATKARGKKGRGQNAVVEDTVQVVIQPGQPTVKPAEIEGFSFTLNALAAFMIKMMKSNYFDEIDLVHTEEFEFGKHKAYNFKVNCKVHYLSDEELEEIVGRVASESNKKLN